MLRVAASRKFLNFIEVMKGKIHNFCAGPAVVPAEAVSAVELAVRDFAGSGVSLLSTSHRSREWQEVMDDCRSLWKELLDIPEGYEVLFLPGGASMGFLYAIENFFESKAAYLDTGVWAGKALKEAQGFGQTVVVASSRDRNYSYIPKAYAIPSDADYFHITSNNTIYGTQMKQDPVSPVPVLADMSSDILSRRVDVSRYAMIYGGAQKNAGTAGVAFCIVRKDALGHVTRHIPSMLDLRKMVEHESMFNTPPMLPIFVMRETLRWLKAFGGVDAAHEAACAKAKLLYDEIDRNSLFTGTADKQDRSLMNACFVLAPGRESLEDRFVQEAEKEGIVGVRGHRYVGGFRASIYNACTMEDVQALVAFMKDFEHNYSV